MEAAMHENLGSNDCFGCFVQWRSSRIWTQSMIDLFFCSWSYFLQSVSPNSEHVCECFAPIEISSSRMLGESPRHIFRSNFHSSPLNCFGQPYLRRVTVESNLVARDSLWFRPMVVVWNGKERRTSRIAGFRLSTRSAESGQLHNIAFSTFQTRSVLCVLQWVCLANHRHGLSKWMVPQSQVMGEEIAVLKMRKLSSALEAVSRIPMYVAMIWVLLNGDFRDSYCDLFSWCLKHVFW